jgi:Uma2 family endonuclease
MPPTVPTPTVTEDPFRYGWRDVYSAGPDGQEAHERVPLTLEDVLHPQEGDVIFQNEVHASDCRYLANVFSTRPIGPPHAVVTEDKGIQWGVEGIRHHSPDIGVFVGLSREPERGSAMLELAELQGRCVLVIEVVSPSTRVNDVVTKIDHYYRVGVPLYVIIDQVKEDGPRALRAYRHGPKHFLPVELDGQGRLLLPLLGLRLGLREGRVVCFDGQTGQELGDYSQVVRELQEKDQKIEDQDRAIEEQVLARQEADRRTRDALKEADQHKKEADRHKQEADRQRQAREQADERLRELEALVRTLQQGGAGNVGPTS